MQASTRTSEAALAQSVTVVIEHQPLPGAAQDYEHWLQRIIPVAGRSPGYRGVHVLRPAPGRDLYTVTLRFDDIEAAQAWLASDARRALMHEVAPLLQQGEAVRAVTGIEFWFTAATARERSAPAWKQFLIAWSVIYPLTLAVPWALQPLLEPLARGPLFLVGHLIDTGAVVFLMTFVVMPRYTRRVAAWLFR